MTLRVTAHPMALVVLIALLAGCDRLGKRGAEPTDARWQGDSTLLAGQPIVLFRLQPRGDTAVNVVPFATVTPKAGLQELHLGPRGWRAFDLAYLQERGAVRALRNGRASNALTIVRGMWNPSPPDSTACANPVAYGVGTTTDRPDGLAVAPSPPPLRHSAELSAGELQQVLSTMQQLVAPTAGISTSQLSRYARTVHQVPSGSGASPSVVVTYDDPERVADSIPAVGERPRHLTVILDKGIYGYRPSWTYPTVGNRGTPPRLRFVDFVDVNGDGLAELFFTPRENPTSLVVLEYKSEAWREMVTYRARRCDN